jgi:hypothetical protein
MPILGRNVLCHCGSGRKYKRCCLAKDAAAKALIRRRAFTQRERANASSLLEAAFFDETSPFRADAAFGQIEFFGEEFARVDEADQERVVSQQPCAAGFGAWLAFDHPVYDGHTVCRMLLDSPNAKVSPGEREYLERMTRSRMGVYEVRDVRRDQGLTLVDLWTNQVHEVSERLGTHSLVRYDVLGARLMEGPLGDTEIDGAVYPFNQDDAAGLLATLRAEWKRMKKKNSDVDEHQFLKRVGGPIINRYWVHRVFLRPLPKLSTTDGESVELCKVVFDVKDQTAVRAALDSESSFEADDEGGYVWLEPSDGDFTRRILGSLKLSQKRLVVETMNRARAQRVQELLERVAGDALRHRLTEHASIERALAEYQKHSEQPSREPAIPDAVEQEILNEYKTAYYRRWMDEPVPALNGRTPRHSAKLKTQRPKVIALLKELERLEAHSQIGGRPSFDVAWIWSELGLIG